MAAIRPLQRPVPLRQSVYDALIDLIVNGELPPGQHMVETDLARQLGVSRQPIREALHRMEAEGWVDLRPSQGAFVHVPADSEVDDLLDVRALLEAETARLAAGAAGPQRVARLREICRKGRAAAEADDFGVAVTTNNAFHAEVAAIAGNSMLAELAEIVGRRVQWYYRLVVPARGQVSWTEHQELVDAIEAADAERAQQLAREHTRRTREAYHASKQPLHVPAPCLWAGGHLPAGGRVLACGGRHLASGGSAPGGGGSAQVRTCPRASGMTGGSLAVPRHTSRSSHSRLARRYDVDAAFMQLELHGCGIHAVCQAAVAA